MLIFAPIKIMYTQTYIHIITNIIDAKLPYIFEKFSNIFKYKEKNKVIKYQVILEKIAPGICFVIVLYFLGIITYIAKNNKNNSIVNNKFLNFPNTSNIIQKIILFFIMLILFPKDIVNSTINIEKINIRVKIQASIFITIIDFFEFSLYIYLIPFIKEYIPFDADHKANIPDIEIILKLFK